MGMTNTRPVTDYEFTTHVWPVAVENWTDANDGRYPATDAEYVEIDAWAAMYREQYNDGSMEITWR
jgi:hypothetical protein